MEVLLKVTGKGGQPSSLATSKSACSLEYTVISRQAVSLQPLGEVATNCTWKVVSRVTGFSKMLSGSSWLLVAPSPNSQLKLLACVVLLVKLTSSELQPST